MRKLGKEDSHILWSVKSFIKILSLLSTKAQKKLSRQLRKALRLWKEYFKCARMTIWFATVSTKLSQIVLMWIRQVCAQKDHRLPIRRLLFYSIQTRQLRVHTCCFLRRIVTLEVIRLVEARIIIHQCSEIQSLVWTLIRLHLCWSRTYNNFQANKWLLSRLAKEQALHLDNSMPIHKFVRNPL